MKVFLYEPFRAGHRLVILGYVQKSLKRANIGCVVHTESVQNAPAGELVELQRLAEEAGCDLIHVLTADGRGKDWFRNVFSPQSQSPRLPVVTTYYLFTHLYKQPSAWIWKLIAKRLGIAKFLISDDYQSWRKWKDWRAQRLCFLPDPWDKDDFILSDRESAAKRLALAPAAARVLLFGDLSRRKGLDVILSAFSAVTNPGLKLVLAGAAPVAGFHSDDQRLIDVLKARGTLEMRLGYVAETAVADYFCACDFVLCAYPAWFGVSSGTFTRACAAGRPVIAATHGILGRLISEHRVGRTFATGKADSLRVLLEDCISDSGEPNWREFDLASAKQLAANRELSHFGNALCSAYKEAVQLGAKSAHGR